MGVAIAAVTGRAGRNSGFSEQRSEILNRLLDQFLLIVAGEKTRLRFFRIPILVANPGHAPEDVRRLRLPKQAQKLCALWIAAQSVFNRQRTKMAYAVKPRLKNAQLNAGSVSFQ